MRFASGLGAILLCAAAVAAQENYAQWPAYKNVTINTRASGANVAATQLNFPVLVRLGADDSGVFLAGGTGGASVRFAKASGAHLPYQIDSWDSAGRAASIWVKLDSVKGNDSLQNFRLYWGKAGSADSSRGSAVFDTADGYGAVWHLGEAATPSLDATAFGSNANWKNGPASGTGIIGNSIFLNNLTPTTTLTTHKFLSAPYNAANNNFKATSAGGVTLSAWVNRTDSTRHANAFGVTGIAGRFRYTGSAPLNNQRMYALSESNKLKANGALYRFNVTTDGTGGTETILAGTVGTDSTWYHMTATFKNGVQALYQNGVLVASAAVASIPLLDSAWTGVPFTIGKLDSAAGNPQLFTGRIDEVRLSKRVRDSDWIKLEYANQKAGQTVVSVGAALNPNAAPTNLTYTLDSAVYTVGTAIAANNASVTGAVDSFTVAPNLPGGLLLNKTTGTISGTPGAATPAALYTVTARNAAGTATVALSITVEGAPETFTQWAYHKNITLNTSATGANVATGQGKFPMLVRLGSAQQDVFYYSVGRGADLRFTRADSVTALPYHIERWDSAGRKAEIWVLVDTVLGNNGTQNIRMYWGKTGVASRSSGPAVFGLGGYAAVWHLGETATPSLDATQNGSSAVWLGGPTSVAGLIGNAVSFANEAAPGQFLSASYSAATSNFKVTSAGGLTLSAWARRAGPLSATSVYGYAGIAGRFRYTGGAPSNNHRMFGLSDSNQALPVFGSHFTTNGTGTATTEYVLTSAAAVDTTWNHIATTLKNGEQNFYLNGVLASTRAIASLPMLDSGWADVPFTIAKLDSAATNAQYFNGVIDEVELAKGVRTADWIKLSYQTQKANTSAVSLGATTPPAPPVGVSARAAGDVAPDLSVARAGKGLVFRISGVPEALEISLVDMRGRAVWSRNVGAGAADRRVAWNGQARDGGRAAAGIYVVRMTPAGAKGRALEKRIAYAP